MTTTKRTATMMTKTTKSSSNSSPLSPVWAGRMTPVLTAFLYGTLLMGYHFSTVEAGNTSSVGNKPDGEQRRQDDEFELSSLNNLHFLLFFSFIVLTIEMLTYISTNWNFWFPQTKQIPVRGKHLDELSNKDYLFLGLNKMATGPFLYFYLRYSFEADQILWSLSKINMTNTVLPLPLLFIVYDFVYTILHWALHIKAIYGYIHKHHHHQKAPSRGNQDAINVHPIEFFLGEYNHLLALYICHDILHLQIHVVCTLLFVTLGGILAGLNHTRHDVMVKVWGTNITLFDSKAHDVHHRIPQSNYGQYIMLWDTIFGTFRSYNPHDRVNPSSQLDPKTGKSFDYYGKKKNDGKETILTNTTTTKVD